MDPTVALEVAAMSRQHAADVATARGDSTIQRWYKGASTLVTGGSGFLGKQLVEKLLRACDVNKIYLLVRTKKGKNPEERLAEILADPLFEKLRQMKPNFADKLVVVNGDVAEIRLGLDDNSWREITEEVNVIFHMAATTRLNDTLQYATLTNVRGTREALRLGKACRNLRSFLYVSTAFSHCTQSKQRQRVLEQFYESPIPPNIMIRMAETFDKATLDAITPQLLRGDWINTYTFTKVIAEEAVRQMAGELPVSVVRPAIVICAYREPTPGWLDMSCTYGPTGLVVGAGLGILHTILGNNATHIDLVPVDLVNNAIVTAAWQTALAQGAEPTIYTVTAKRNPISFGDLEHNMRSATVKSMSSKTFWYPCWKSTPNKFLFWLLYWLFHYIPAYVADGVGLLFGKKFRAVYQCTKGYKMITTLAPFTLNHWDFDDANLQSLQRFLSPTDKQIFNFDITTVDNKEFLQIWWLGVRKYICKEQIKGTERLTSLKLRLVIFHFTGCTIYAYVLWMIINSVFSLRLLF